MSKYKILISDFLCKFYVYLIPLYYGGTALTYAFSESHIIQDDARIHIVWLEKHINSGLFSNDLLSNYFTETYGALGFKSFYQLMGKLGIKALDVAKILPVFLGIITSVYYYKFCNLITSSKIISLISVLILNQNIWMNNDITSSTPRAFVFPIFSGFLYYFSRNKNISCMLMIMMQGLFYPPFVLIEVGILLINIIEFKKKEIKLANTKSRFTWAATALAVGIISLLPEILKKKEYGSLITFAQMKQMPDFYPNGRSQFFSNNIFEFIWNGSSGINLPEYPFVMWLFFLFPLISKDYYKNYIDKSKIEILFKILLVALGLYVLAHIFMFRLYWPNRFTYHTLPFVVSLLSGILISVAVNKIKLNVEKKKFKKLIEEINLRKLILPFFIIILFFYSTIYALIPSNFLDKQGWIVGNNQKIYEFLSKTPMDTLVGSLSNEASNIPAFALRSVLTARELAVPYHMGFYSEFSDRMRRMIFAQYAPTLNPMKKIIRDYDIDYWILDKEAFSKDYFSRRKINLWLNQYPPESDQAVKQLQSQQIPALAKVVSQCTIVADQSVNLLSASCISALPS